MRRHRLHPACADVEGLNFKTTDHCWYTRYHVLYDAKPLAGPAPERSDPSAALFVELIHGGQRSRVHEFHRELLDVTELLCNIMAVVHGVELQLIIQTRNC